MPVEVFAPGEFITEELEARGWSQSTLAARLGRPVLFVAEIISGKRAITEAVAETLASAFGTSAELWMNLEASYQESLDPYHDNKVYHYAAKVRSDGAVAALCFKKPRAIDLSRALWTNRHEAVTCERCLALLEAHD